MGKYVVKSELGKFYVGDITYKANKLALDNWESNDYEDGKFDVEDPATGKIYSYAVYGTGRDGCFFGTSEQSRGKCYGVDAGVIGVIPAELFGDREDSDFVYFEGKEMTMEVNEESGEFTFKVDGEFAEYILTGEVEEDEEDDWDADEDDEKPWGDEYVDDEE